jgi:hypothetical protein
MTQMPIVVPPEGAPLDVPVDPEPDERPADVPDETGGESLLDEAQEQPAPAVSASFAGY